MFDAFHDSDALYQHYDKFVTGFAVKKYHWLQGRSCLLAVDDIVQLARIALLEVSQEWPQLRLTRDRGQYEDREFWRYLETAIRGGVLGEARRLQRHHHDEWDRSIDAIQEAFDTPGQHISSSDATALIEGDERTSLRVGRSSATWMMTHEAAVDYFAILPRRHKIIIALRYFDDMTLPAVKRLLGRYAGDPSTLSARAIESWRAYVRTLFLDDADNVAPLKARNRGGDEPYALTRFVRERYGSDVDGWLGFVTRCFREDVSYMVDILGHDVYVPPGAYGATLSPFQQTQVDVWRAAGVSIAEIGRRLNVTWDVVKNYTARRYAA